MTSWQELAHSLAMECIAVFNYSLIRKKEFGSEASEHFQQNLGSEEAGNLAMTLQSISKKNNIFDQEETTTLALKLPTVLKRTFEQKKTRIQQ